MRWVDVLIVGAVVVVSAWLGWRAPPRAQAVLWLTALLLSALLFLPMSLLVGLLPADQLQALRAAAGAAGWTPSDAVHFVAFAWLALVLWLLRPDLRGVRAIAVILVLAVAGELVQGLTVEREARIDDVLVDLAGAALGLLLGWTIDALRRARLPSRR